MHRRSKAAGCLGGHIDDVGPTNVRDPGQHPPPAISDGRHHHLLDHAAIPDHVAGIDPDGAWLQAAVRDHPRIALRIDRQPGDLAEEGRLARDHRQVRQREGRHHAIGGRNAVGAQQQHVHLFAGGQRDGEARVGRRERRALIEEAAIGHQVPPGVDGDVLHHAVEDHRLLPLLARPLAHHELAEEVAHRRARAAVEGEVEGLGQAGRHQLEQHLRLSGVGGGQQVLAGGQEQRVGAARSGGGGEALEEPEATVGWRVRADHHRPLRAPDRAAHHARHVQQDLAHVEGIGDPADIRHLQARPKAKDREVVRGGGRHQGADGIDAVRQALEEEAAGGIEGHGQRAIDAARPQHRDLAALRRLTRRGILQLHHPAKAAVRRLLDRVVEAEEAARTQRGDRGEGWAKLSCRDVGQLDSSDPRASPSRPLTTSVVRHTPSKQSPSEWAGFTSEGSGWRPPLARQVNWRASPQKGRAGPSLARQVNWRASPYPPCVASSMLRTARPVADGSYSANPFVSSPSSASAFTTSPSCPGTSLTPGSSMVSRCRV